MSYIAEQARTLYRRYLAYDNPRESFRSECPTAGDLRSPLFTTSGTCWTLGTQIRSSLSPSPGLPRAKGLLCGPRPICQSTPVVEIDQERCLFELTCRHPFCHILYRTSATAFFWESSVVPFLERLFSSQTATYTTAIWLPQRTLHPKAGQLPVHLLPSDGQCGCSTSLSFTESART